MVLTILALKVCSLLLLPLRQPALGFFFSKLPQSLVVLRDLLVPGLYFRIGLHFLAFVVKVVLEFLRPLPVAAKIAIGLCPSASVLNSWIVDESLLGFVCLTLAILGDLACSVSATVERRVFVLPLAVLLVLSFAGCDAVVDGVKLPAFGRGQLLGKLLALPHQFDFFLPCRVKLALLLVADTSDTRLCFKVLPPLSRRLKVVVDGSHLRVRLNLCPSVVQVGLGGRHAGAVVDQLTFGVVSGRHRPASQGILLKRLLGRVGSRLRLLDG